MMLACRVIPVESEEIVGFKVRNKNLFSKLVYNTLAEKAVVFDW